VLARLDDMLAAHLSERLGGRLERGGDARGSLGDGRDRLDETVPDDHDLRLHALGWTHRASTRRRAGAPALGGREQRIEALGLVGLERENQHLAIDHPHLDVGSFSHADDGDRRLGGQRDLAEELEVRGPREDSLRAVAPDDEQQLTADPIESAGDEDDLARLGRIDLGRKEFEQLVQQGPRVLHGRSVLRTPLPREIDWRWDPVRDRGHPIVQPPSTTTHSPVK